MRHPKMPKILGNTWTIAFDLNFQAKWVHTSENVPFLLAESQIPLHIEMKVGHDFP